MEFFDPVERSESEYKKSQLITESLKVLIKKQDINLADYQSETIASVTSDISRDKEVKLLRKLADNKSGISDEHFKRYISLAKGKVAGAWRIVLPIGSFG